MVELEALAVILTITKLKKYLLGRPFIIQSDNQPICVATSGVQEMRELFFGPLSYGITNSLREQQTI